MMSKTFVRSQAFDVFQNRRDPIFHTMVEHKIDTVFYAEREKMSVTEVRKQLIEHDGYPDNIIVRKAVK
jgi:hypothetical protein